MTRENNGEFKKPIPFGRNRLSSRKELLDFCYEKGSPSRVQHNASFLIHRDSRMCVTRPEYNLTFTERNDIF